MQDIFIIINEYGQPYAINNFRRVELWKHGKHYNAETGRQFKTLEEARAYVASTAID